MSCRFQNQIFTKNYFQMVCFGGSLGTPQGTQMDPKINFLAFKVSTPAPWGPKRPPEDPGRAPRGPQEATRGRPEASKKWVKNAFETLRIYA